MSNLNLWNELDKLKKTCKWIDLSHEVSAETPHWHGFSSLKSTALYELEKDGFTTHTYEIVGQYGTHVDAPIHFVKGERTLDTFTPEDMAMPLCVIDKSKEVEENNDFAMRVEDILEWESVHGKIPEAINFPINLLFNDTDGFGGIEIKDKKGQSFVSGELFEIHGWEADAEIY